MKKFLFVLLLSTIAVSAQTNKYAARYFVVNYIGTNDFGQVTGEIAITSLTGYLNQQQTKRDINADSTKLPIRDLVITNVRELKKVDFDAYYWTTKDSTR